MAELKTKVNDASVEAFLNTVPDEKKRADAKAEEARRANEATKSALAQVPREKERAQSERTDEAVAHWPRPALSRELLTFEETGSECNIACKIAVQ